MPKLYFRHGTMNSSKTANLLMTAYNFTSQQKKVKLMKPILDTRFGDKVIQSRAVKGMTSDVIITPDMRDFSNILPVDCVLVDEAQFLSKSNIDGLRDLAMHTIVICYGLRTDYKTELFEGSKRLFEVADTIEEIKTSCGTCERKAVVNSKFIVLPDNTKKIVKSGSSNIDLGCEEKYQALCWGCYQHPLGLIM
jgi:thymidine kinase